MKSTIMHEHVVYLIPEQWPMEVILIMPYMLTNFRDKITCLQIFFRKKYNNDLHRRGGKKGE